MSVTALDGVLFFAALKATGTLWVPIAVHTLGDFGRYLTSGNTDPDMGHTNSGSVAIWIQVALGVLVIPVIVSAIRTDLRARRERSSIT